MPHWSRAGVLGEEKLEKEISKDDNNALISHTKLYIECFRKTLPKILRPTYATTGNTHSTEFQGSHSLKSQENVS